MAPPKKIPLLVKKYKASATKTLPVSKLPPVSRTPEMALIPVVPVIIEPEISESLPIVHVPEQAVPAPVPEQAVPAPVPEQAVPAPVPEQAVPAPVPEQAVPAPVPEQAAPVPVPEPAVPVPSSKPIDTSTSAPVGTRVYSDDALRMEIDDNIDPDEDKYISLQPQQKEDLIDKLETKKFKLKKAYKTELAAGHNIDSIKAQLKEVCRLLAVVKKCDAIDKINHLKGEANTLASELEKKYTKLAIKDFNMIIDLTAPREERQPDISTEQIWNRSKNVIFKNKTYRSAATDKKDKFRSKMKLKTMPKDIRNKLHERTDDTVNNINVHQNHPNLLKYQTYDPISFNGLNIY
jgi:hypothetical protein